MNPIRVMRLLARYRPLYLLLSLVVWVGFYVVPVAVGWILQVIVDRILGAGTGETSVQTLLAAYGGLGLINLLVIAAATWTWFGVELGLCGLMRRNMLDWLLNGKGARSLPDTTGESLSRLRDDVREVALYFEYYVDMAGISVFTGLAVWIMCRISIPMTMLVLIPLFGVVFIVGRMSHLIRRLRRRRRESTGRVTSFIGECFSAVQTIKANNAESCIAKVFQRLNHDRLDASVKDQLLTELLMSLNYIMFNLTLGLLLCGVGAGVREGSFTVGNLVLFMAYLPRLSHAISMLGKMLAQHKRSSVSIQRMEAMTEGAPPGTAFLPQPLYLDGKFPPIPSVESGLNTPFQSMEVRKLSSHYPNGMGIRDVNLEIRRGEILAITGRIASGKTTLIRSLLGLLPKESGEILWDGQIVEDPASFLIPPRCAYTPQVPWLFSDQLKYNILLGEESRPCQLDEALQLAVLEPDIAHLENGIETIVGPRGMKLSGGQIQRSSAARMFVREPALLVMDDLSSALDVETEKALWERLRSEKRTCLIATHRKTALRMADRILVLKDGRMEDCGPLDELLERCEEMRELWRTEKE